MFLDTVEEVVEGLAKEIVKGKFYIGLEPIKEYIFFYCLADQLQQAEENKKVSIQEYAIKNYRPKNDNDTIEKFYERKIDHYNNLNFEMKQNLRERQEKERQLREEKIQKGIRPEGNPQCYEGNILQEFQLSEFDILDSIKEGNYDTSKANLTYKRIVSEQGYLSLMTFRDFTDFVTLLTNDILHSNDMYKNIRYYKLEKRLGFEHVKSVLKALSLSRKIGVEPETIVRKDLIKTFHLPLLLGRQKYALVYPKLSFTDKIKWRLEIKSILLFLTRCLIVMKEKVSEEYNIITQEDWVKFQSIYTPDTFQNNYKQRKDFSAEDFKLLMKDMDYYNVMISENLDMNS